ncbi:hypothetical protein IAU60_001077 [Kwoniella sp. DSM 27419]
MPSELLAPLSLRPDIASVFDTDIAPDGDRGHGAVRASRVEPPWEKVLWRRQPFADNYVPPGFLAELDALPPRKAPRLVPLFYAVLPISLHLCVISLFLSIFHGMLERAITPEAVGWGCVVAGVGGWGVWKAGWGLRAVVKTVEDDPLIPSPTPLRSLILPPLLLALLSPVLGTLTSATTSDSIWPLAAGLGFVHLLLVDFSTGEDMRLSRRKERARRLNADASAMARTTGSGIGTRGRSGSVVLHQVEDTKSLSSSLSLTSALSASVVLASRLPSTSHVFSLVLLAVLLFAGWPKIAKAVREAGKVFSLLLTTSTALLAISLFPHGHDWHIQVGQLNTRFNLVLPSTPTIVLVSALLVTNALGPAMLIYAWRWKTRRGGGWDVAVVRVRKGPRG